MRAFACTCGWFAKLRMLIVLAFIASVTYYWNDLRDLLTGAPRGELLLFVSASTHDLKGIDRALRQGTSINARSGTDLTALHYACGSGDDVMVKALLDRGADANADAQQLVTPLRDAIASGNERSVELLLAAGGDPNVVHTEGTVLDVAEQSGFTNMVELLRQHGAKRAAELRRGA